MKREVCWTWTNWTFGVYWGHIGKKFVIGIDVGPFEVIWKKEKRIA
jgi:hypothetical protein